MSELHKNMEIRKLPFGSLSRIIDILETDNDWKKLMSNIPKHPQNTQFEPKYNNEHVRLIENHSHLSGRKCTAILLEEWGTSGRIRPTLIALKDLLVKCDMYRAADEIASLLNEPVPQRPMDGPAASIDTDVSMLLNNESIKQKLNAMDSIKNISNINSYNNANNRTTAQMKSASDLIKFSVSSHSTFTPTEKKPAPNSDLIKFSQLSTNVLQSDDLPNVSALTPFGNQTTAQIKSVSDFNKFSSNQESMTTQSANIPNLTALMSQTEVSEQNDISNDATSLATNNTPAVPDTSSLFTESSFQSSGTSPSQNMTNSAIVYQTTFPNIELSQNLNNTNKMDDFKNTNLIHFEYQELQQITNNFSKQITVGSNGITGKIGMGGFGEVFVGVHSKLGTLAVKKAHNDQNRYMITIKAFNSEVKYLSQFKHENIVPIIGYSKDGPVPCIVCAFIDGGSLEHKIAARVLNEKQRINIIMGTAEGLKYLHTSECYNSTDTELENSKRNNFLHGDVKSANILLTKDCTPKLCDFGLAKQYDTTFITTSPIGTSAYMAPEGFSGTITQKIDIYSFGIVLLELLTGLKSIVIENNDRINIKTYVEENSINDEITNLLDSVVENWTMAADIYKLAKACLETNRQQRLAIDDVCKILYEIKSQI